MTLTTISAVADGDRGIRHQGDELHLLREIVRAHQVLMTSFTRHMGMPGSQFAVMRLLASSENGMGVMEIAEALGVNAAAVTRLAKDMEGRRLIRRRADARDGRRHYISLSDKGTKLFAEIHDRSHELERQLVSGIGREEIAAAAAVLARLRGFIEELDSK